MQAGLRVSAEQPEVLALKACVSNSVPKLLRQSSGPIVPFLLDDHKAISRRQKKGVLPIALDLPLLRPIRALLVACIVSGKLWDRTTSRPFLACSYWACQFSCLVRLRSGILFRYLGHLMASF